MLNTLTHFDAYLFTLINSHHTLFLDWLFLAITQFGNGWVAIPLTALIIILKTPREFLAKALLCAAVAGTFSGVLNTQVKHIVHRDRPALCCTRVDSAGQNIMKPVHVVGKTLRHNSFPSGHSNTVFTAVTILALYFGGYFFYGYLAAFLIALSRVYVGAHFPLDTAGGAIMGCFAAMLIIALFRSRKWLPEQLIQWRKSAEQ
jgi:undecaprenyl-diphosphatase